MQDTAEDAMPHDRESIGARIRKLRTAAGLSQDALASRIGVSKGAVSQWENDQIANLKAMNLMELANEFQRSPEEIWTGTPRKTQAEATSDIPQHRLDLIRAYGRLPDAWRKPIRMMIESLDASIDPKRHEFEAARARASDAIRKTAKPREKSET